MQPTTIVLADDDEAIRNWIGPWLRAAGHTVWEASDGDEAVALVREHRPALLLLDLWMPGADGLQVLESLRHDPAADCLTTLVLTADREADARLEALSAGAAGFVEKDGDLEAMQRQLNACLAARPPFFEAEDRDREPDSTEL